MIMKISTMILIEIKKRDYDNKTEKQNNKNIKRKRKDVTFNITLGPIDNDRHKSRKTNRRERKFIPKETIERETTEKPPIEKDSNIENGDKDTNEPVDHPSKKADKCLFYPNCTKPDCPFFHPTENCKLFPACPFGKKCRFIHPDIPCEYGSMCLRLGCSYTHPKKIKTPCKHGFSCNDKYTTCGYIHPAESCRFGFFCKKKRKGCRYSHVKPCNFGAECRVVGCTFGHASTSQQLDEENNEKLSLSLPKTPPRTDKTEDTEIKVDLNIEEKQEENGEEKPEKTNHDHSSEDINIEI